MTSNVQRFEAQFQSPPPWREANRKIRKEFLIWLSQRLPKSEGMDAKTMATCFVINCETGRNGQQLEKLETFWDSYQEEQEQQDAALPVQQPAPEAEDEFNPNSPAAIAARQAVREKLKRRGLIE